MRPVHLEVYSDYLCPWCHLADHRLKALKEEFGDDLELEFKTYLLRPRPEERDLEKFMRYTQSWMRPASEPDAPTFRVWETTEGPPTHSVPAQLVAKAAAIYDAGLDDPAIEPVTQQQVFEFFKQNIDRVRAVLAGAVASLPDPLPDCTGRTGGIVPRPPAT